MKIGAELSKDDFQYDLYALIRSFFPEDELTLYIRGDEEKGAGDYALRIIIEISDYTDREAEKNHLKHLLYESLSAYTGRTLPWGTLSGIRPVRLVLSDLMKGVSPEAAKEDFQAGYLVSEEKAALAVSIAQKERAVISALPDPEFPYSLYVHIPFCPTVCAYCSFSSSPEAVWKRCGDEYLDALLRDLELSSEIAGGQRSSPQSVYVGGGTPTVLNAAQLDRLLNGIGTHFYLGDTIEYTVEAGRPDSITPEKLAVLKRHGVSRISVNPQSMNEETLRRIGRGHTAEDVRRAFYEAREAGFQNINMDIILGLPGEGRDEVIRTLEEIRRLDPDALTVHALAIKRASRIRSEIAEDRQKDPDADRGHIRGSIMNLTEDLQEFVYKRAAGMGMGPYYLYRQKNARGNLENTGFSKAGKECLYNIVTMEEVHSVIACGAGAVSKRVERSGLITRCDAAKDPALYMERLAEMVERKRKLFAGIEK